MNKQERLRTKEEAQRVRALIAQLSPDRRKAFKRELAKVGSPTRNSTHDSPSSPSPQEAQPDGGKAQGRVVATPPAKRTGRLPSKTRARIWLEERSKAKAKGIKATTSSRSRKRPYEHMTDREVMDIVNGMTPDLMGVTPRKAKRTVARVQWRVDRAKREIKGIMEDARKASEPAKPAKPKRISPASAPRVPIEIEGFRPNAAKGRPKKTVGNRHTNAARAPWDEAGISRRTWYRHLRKSRLASAAE